MCDALKLLCQVPSLQLPTYILTHLRVLYYQAV